MKKNYKFLVILALFVIFGIMIGAKEVKAFNCTVNGATMIAPNQFYNGDSATLSDPDIINDAQFFANSTGNRNFWMKVQYYDGNNWYDGFLGSYLTPPLANGVVSNYQSRLMVVELANGQPAGAWNKVEGPINCPLIPVYPRDHQLISAMDNNGNAISNSNPLVINVLQGISASGSFTLKNKTSCVVILACTGSLCGTRNSEIPPTYAYPCSNGDLNFSLNNPFASLAEDQASRSGVLSDYQRFDMLSNSPQRQAIGSITVTANTDNPSVISGISIHEHALNELASSIGPNNRPYYVSFNLATNLSPGSYSGNINIIPNLAYTDPNDGSPVFSSTVIPVQLKVIPKSNYTLSCTALTTSTFAGTGDTFTATAAGTVINAPLTFKWSGNSCNSTVSGSNAQTCVVNNIASTTQPVTITATDPYNYSASATCPTVTIKTLPSPAQIKTDYPSIASITGGGLIYVTATHTQSIAFNVAKALPGATFKLIPESVSSNGVVQRIIGQSQAGGQITWPPSWSIALPGNQRKTDLNDFKNIIMGIDKTYVLTEQDGSYVSPSMNLNCSDVGVWRLHADFGVASSTNVVFAVAPNPNVLGACPSSPFGGY